MRNEGQTGVLTLSNQAVPYLAPDLFLEPGDALDLNISQGLEYMPQTGKEETTVKFNYMMGDQLIKIKFREARKNFKLLNQIKILN